MTDSQLHYLQTIKKGKNIAFEYQYSGDEDPYLMIAKVSHAYESSFLVHFLHGYHSVGEVIPFDKVLAVVEPNVGQYCEMKGWNGHFVIMEAEGFEKYRKTTAKVNL